MPNPSSTPVEVVWMLWLDDHPKAPLAARLAEAAAYYTRKYGARPTHALVPLGANGTPVSGWVIAEDPYTPTRHLALRHDGLGETVSGEQGASERVSLPSSDQPLPNN